MRSRPDRVLLTGATLAVVASLALPLASLRPNRLVPGTPYGIAAGGTAGWLVVAFGVIAAAAAFIGRARGRGAAAMVAGAGILISLAFAIGHAARTLLPPDGIERVSAGTGAWVTLLAGAAVAFAGDQALGGRRLPRAVLAAALACGLAAAVAWGGLADVSIAAEYEVQRTVFWQRLAGHVLLAGASLALATAVGVPLGVWAARSRAARRVTLTATGAIQTVPSLALLGLLIGPIAALTAAYPVLRTLGIRAIGFAPAFVALTLYGLLPVVRDTYLGLSGVDAASLDAGRGMGMTSWQLLVRVRFPLALPLVLEGVRIAAVLLIGIATVTALAGALTLGTLVFDGLAQGAIDLILLGALPVIVLAVLADGALRVLGRAVTPRGVRG